MNGLSKLNNKLKIIILVVYTVIAVVVSFVILNSLSKTTVMNGYSDKIEDEYVNVAFRIQEQRTSSNQNKTDSESSSYKIYAYVEKKTQKDDVKLSINDIKIYLAGENTEGKLLFDEPSSSITKKISESGKSTSFESNISSNDVFTKKMDSDDKIKNNEPKKLYFKVVYTANKTDESSDATSKYTEERKEIKYVVDVNDFDESKYQNVDVRKKVDGSNRIVNDGEPYDLQIKKSVSDSTSTKKDRFNFIISLNQPNLGSKVLKNIKIEVYGKVKNDTKDVDNNFSDYILMYTYCGSLISSTGSNITTDVDQAYELSEMIIISNVVFDDNVKQTTTYKFIW